MWYFEVMRVFLMRVRNTLISRWMWVLGVLSLVGFIVNSLIFYPGFMSADSLSQLGQAQSITPVGDWHPPVMVFVWKALIKITGLVSSMMLFQHAILWSALFLFALSVYEWTKSIKKSVTPFLLSCLPFTLAISGVIWKDVQMAYALLLAVALFVVLLSFAVKRGWIRWSIFASAALLLVYAVLLRYNALVAVIPILYFGLSLVLPVTRWWKKLLLILPFFVVVVGVSAGISTVLHVEKQNPISSVMLEDIVYMHTHDELSEKARQGGVYEHILAIKKCALADNILVNIYWWCTNSEQRHAVHIRQYDDIRGYWIETVLHHPDRYILRKIHTFTAFLFVPTAYVFQDGIQEDWWDGKVKYPELQGALSVYVLSFGHKHFSYMFEPWFWLALAVLTLWFAFRYLTGYYRGLVVALALSSILYIISYIPVVVGFDFRYSYWSVWAVLVAGLLIIVEGKGMRKAFRRSRRSRKN